MRADAGRRRREDGAVAVEFALLLPILILFLFGIIQYGYGLFQLQSFNSALSNSSQLAATGITDCTTFNDSLRNLVSNNGVNKLNSFFVTWEKPDGSTSSQPQPGDLVKVSATFTPFKIGIPGIPFPSTITRTQVLPIQDVGLSSITGCSWQLPR